MRHENVEPTRWMQAIHQMDGLCPPAQVLTLEPISPEQWRDTIMSKSTHTACGLDGVSRQDLLSMPRDLVVLLIEVCEEAELTGIWPYQAMQSVITAIEKTSTAARVHQYRPINVMSTVYRTWASIRTKQLLRYLATIAPTGLVGMIPGKTTADVWYTIQTRIEASRISGRDISGMSADLGKAFNLLPRLPVWTYCRHLGVHQGVIRGWAGATMALQRRFKVRNSVGNLWAQCGGCASRTACYGGILCCLGPPN